MSILSCFDNIRRDILRCIWISYDKSLLRRHIKKNNEIYLCSCHAVYYNTYSMWFYLMQYSKNCVLSASALSYLIVKTFTYFFTSTIIITQIIKSNSTYWVLVQLYYKDNHPFPIIRFIIFTQRDTVIIVNPSFATEWQYGRPLRCCWSIYNSRVIW